jgi:hypothetical protein
VKKILRRIALLVLLASAAGSLYFVIHAGRNNNSFILRILFVIWVLSPFVAFVFIDAISKQWSWISRRYLYWLMLIVSIGSFPIYSGVWGTIATKPAFIFLIIPLISWLLIVIIIPIVKRLSQRSGL